MASCVPLSLSTSMQAKPQMVGSEAHLSVCGFGMTVYSHTSTRQACREYGRRPRPRATRAALASFYEDDLRRARAELLGRGVDVRAGVVAAPQLDVTHCAIEPGLLRTRPAGEETGPRRRDRVLRLFVCSSNMKPRERRKRAGTALLAGLTLGCFSEAPVVGGTEGGDTTLMEASSTGTALSSSSGADSTGVGDDSTTTESSGSSGASTGGSDETTGPPGPTFCEEQGSGVEVCADFDGGPYSMAGWTASNERNGALSFSQQQAWSEPGSLLVDFYVRDPQADVLALLANRPRLTLPPAPLELSFRVFLDGSCEWAAIEDVRVAGISVGEPAERQLNLHLAPNHVRVQQFGPASVLADLDVTLPADEFVPIQLRIDFAARSLELLVNDETAGTFDFTWLDGQDDSDVEINVGVYANTPIAAPCRYYIDDVVGDFVSPE